MRIVLVIGKQLLPPLAKQSRRLVSAPSQLNLVDVQLAPILPHRGVQRPEKLGNALTQLGWWRKILGPVGWPLVRTSSVRVKRLLELLLDGVHQVLCSIAIIEQILSDDEMQRLIAAGLFVF